jgi:mono/diheme cytochrome c family protein
VQAHREFESHPVRHAGWTIAFAFREPQSCRQKSWEHRVRRFLLLTTLIVSPLLCCATAMAAPAEAAYPALPPGPGRDVEVRVCSQCHSPERPAAQRHDLAGWNDIINTMVNNGAKASDAEFDQIAAYLAQSFPPGKQ